MRTDRPHLRAYDVSHLPDKRRFPGAGDANRLWEDRGAAGHIAAAAFFVDDGGNAKPRVLDQVPLDGVRQRRALGRAEVAGAADARDLSDSIAHQALRLLDGEGRSIKQLVHPMAAHLCDLFGERHA